ncbi:MAG: redox-sensing transcriptional repressor Rex [Bacteroidetes bacterium]|nr:redox-sensing transcriptional repressor Rex [Bacteroidota bacterium]
MRKLPEKTIERLSQYRRVLLICVSKNKQHIFSHELAGMLHLTPVQVRRDIMLIGYSGTLRQGYEIKEMIELIGNILDSSEGLKTCVVGLGNLGRAMISYFNGKRTKLTIVAAFDINPEKVNRIYAGVPCYHIDMLNKMIRSENISIGIMTVPGDEVARVTESMVLSGIKGLLNYTPTPVNVPNHVYLQEYDMITSLEKIAYFVKRGNNEE